MNRLLLPLFFLLSMPTDAAELTAEIQSTSIAYVEALDVAHSFLDSWVARNADTGVHLMASVLRTTPHNIDATAYEAWLRLYVQGLSNPHHAAFELARGKLASPTHAIFPVTLYEAATGERAAFRYDGTIELVREASSWRVSKLPKTSDNSKE